MPPRGRGLLQRSDGQNVVDAHETRQARSTFPTTSEALFSSLVARRGAPTSLRQGRSCRRCAACARRGSQQQGCQRRAIARARVPPAHRGRFFLWRRRLGRRASRAVTPRGPSRLGARARAIHDTSPFADEMPAPRLSRHSGLSKSGPPPLRRVPGHSGGSAAVTEGPARASSGSGRVLGPDDVSAAGDLLPESCGCPHRTTRHLARFLSDRYGDVRQSARQRLHLPIGALFRLGLSSDDVALLRCL
jgi:hypothetical protein